MDEEADRQLKGGDGNTRGEKVGSRSLSPARGGISPEGQSPAKKKVGIQSSSKSQANITGSPGSGKKDCQAAAESKNKATRHKNSVLRESYEVDKAQRERVPPDWFKT